MKLADYTSTTTAQRAFALIYGPPCTGKSTGARTFPGPIHIDFDNNLPAGTPNVIPMWDDAFVDKILPRTNPAYPANRRDALLRVIADISKEVTSQNTLIIDSLTRVETWYNAQEEIEPKPRSAKTGEVDGHALFRKRLIYFDTLLTTFTGCAANVVFIVHQQQDRNEKGDVVAQIRPSLMGQVGEKLPGFFPILLQAVRQTDPATKAVSYAWRVRPGPFEPARVPKPVTVDFIPQQYSKLAALL